MKQQQLASARRAAPFPTAARSMLSVRIKPQRMSAKNCRPVNTNVHKLNLHLLRAASAHFGSAAAQQFVGRLMKPRFLPVKRHQLRPTAHAIMLPTRADSSNSGGPVSKVVPLPK